MGSVPPLDTLIAVLPAALTCLYIHDVVVLPAARGQGAAGLLVDLFEAAAQRHALASLALVSVYGTYVFWERYGFQTTFDPALADKLKSYGETARYMHKYLSVCRVGTTSAVPTLRSERYVLEKPQHARSGNGVEARLVHRIAEEIMSGAGMTTVRTKNPACFSAVRNAADCVSGSTTSSSVP